MVKLRALEFKDAEYMYEWLTDTEVTKDLILGRVTFSQKKIMEFIENSWSDKRNHHFAIANEEDEYIGTVSLKNINYIDKNAEYAIVIRKRFWGKSFALMATDEIINYGFTKLNLHKIYLNALSTNFKANRFYEKMGFLRENVFKEHVYINGSFTDLTWYCIFNTKQTLL